MKSFRVTEMDTLSGASLSKDMQEHGYVLIRGLLPAQALDELLADVADVMEHAGWLLDGSHISERVANAEAACADGDNSYKAVNDEVFRLPSFHHLPHLPELKRVMQMLVGDDLLIHPKSNARLIFPNFENGTIHAHQDYKAIGGDTETFTAWIPLHDCPEELGPLRILEASHRHGLQPAVATTGYIAPGSERGEGWVGGPIGKGDVLLFHSLTVHEAAPNRSRQLRVSLDCRFQSARRPVDPSALVFTGSGRRSWERTYESWPTDELKYYWRDLPLHLRPSIEELTKLAQTADSESMRGRYVRILERLASDMPQFRS